MKISANFDIREFVPKSIWDKFGESSTWFVNQKVIHLAQFYKAFFFKYYTNKYKSSRLVDSVVITVNTWHYISGGMQFRGFRPPSYTKGAKLSQHRFCNAFDCDITIVFRDGKREECNYPEVHKVIKENEAEFMRHGLTCLEDVAIAKTWLHSDCRWMPGSKSIKIVKP